MRSLHGSSFNQLFAPVAVVVFTCALLSISVECPAQEAASRSSAMQQRGTDKEQAARLVSEGVAAFERGDAASAAQLFRRAVQADANNETAHTYLGVLADREGNMAEAEREFAAAAIAAPASPAARNNHGVVLLRLGKTEQAARQFEISLKLDPQQPGALVNLAQIRFNSGTPEGLTAARELFERARALAPDAEIARALVVIALRQKDSQAAAAFYQDYLSRSSSATVQAVAPAARAELGAGLFAAGLSREATEELKAVVAAEPNNVDALVMLAHAYLSLKDIRAAGRTLEAAVARGLESAPVYAALAEIYQAAGHVENAIPAMRLAIERDPRNEAYRFRYGMLLTDTKAPEAAIIRLTEALKEFPNSSKLWFALGVARFKFQKHDQAARDFERAVELDPKFAPALAYLGITYDETGKYSEAIALYEKALAADERLAAAHYLLADAFLRQPSGDTASAEKHLLRAVELEPSFPPARLALARLYSRTERFEDAAAQLERVVATDPNQAEAQYQLSRVYVRLKRAADAEKALAAFKRLSESEQERAQTERQELVRRLANVNF